MRHDEATKMKAVGLAAVVGVKKAAKQMNLPHTTVSFWSAKPEYQHLRDRAKDEVVAEMWTGIQIGLTQVIEGFTGAAPLKDKAMALGVLYDRYALLSGGATSRSDKVDTSTDDMNDTEKKRLRDFIDNLGTAPVAGEARSTPK